MTQKVVIIGAGPSGLLLAHYLLSRGDKYEIEIYERRNDPRQVSFPKYKTFSLALSPRGMNALKQISSLEEAVKGLGLEITGTVIHKKNGKPLFRAIANPQLTLDRTSLAIALLNQLTSTYDSNRVKVHFNQKCIHVCLTTKTVKFESVTDTQTDYKQVDYDLLIGADGAYSVVRETLLKTDNFEYEKRYFYKDYKSIFLSRPDENLKVGIKPGHIHTWRLDDGTNLLLLYQLDGTLGGVVNFPGNKNQIVHLTTKEEVLQFFCHNFPEVTSLITDEEAEAFALRPISKVITVRCDRFHYGDSVLLIGDAAHTVSPAIGQGCNSAFEDVFIFNNLLNTYSDNLAETLREYTIRRRADADALIELSNNTFPLSKQLFFQFIFNLSLTKFLHKLLPNLFPAPLLELITETTFPYSKILSYYKNWIFKVKKSNEQFLSKIQESQ
jgi:kynurenine 3-monooxygenase